MDGCGVRLSEDGVGGGEGDDGVRGEKEREMMGVVGSEEVLRREGR